MRELITEIDIKARAPLVWEILLDFEAYPSWNPFITKIGGAPGPGSRLNVVMEQPGSRSMRFRPRVVVLRPNRELAWKGRLFMPGIFDGEHHFVIEPAARGSVRFVQRERFSGILVALFRKMIDTRTRAGFEAMNRALKRRAEGAGR